MPASLCINPCPWKQLTPRNYRTLYLHCDIKPVSSVRQRFISVTLRHYDVPIKMGVGNIAFLDWRGELLLF